jgi:hypothetical protein
VSISNPLPKLPPRTAATNHEDAQGHIEALIEKHLALQICSRHCCTGMLLPILLYSQIIKNAYTSILNEDSQSKENR